MLSVPPAASVLWTVVAVATLIAFALGMVGLLISNSLGDRVQSILMWLLLLLLSLIWLVTSVAFLSTDALGRWWAGVVISAGIVGAASLSLWRIARRP